MDVTSRRGRVRARRLSLAGIGVVAAFVLAGCTFGSTVTPGTTVTVAVAESFTSLNPATGYGSAVDTNASVAAATNSSFVLWDERGERRADESFGSVTKLKDDPLTVRYAIADGVEWSDGTPVDAADLMLSWAANSRTLNTAEFEAEDFIDPETGAFTKDFPDDVVYFDGFTGNGLQLATQTPTVSDDGRSITLSFDEHFADWQLVLDVGRPAHVVGERALDDAGSTPAKAKAAVLEAIVERDESALAELSRVWNSDFNFSETPDDESLLVGTGPYTLSELVPGESVTLDANRNYEGGRRPSVETVVVRFIADPLEAVGAFADGEVDIVGPQPSADVMAAVERLPGVQRGVDGSHELLQPRFADSMNGAIENELVREAFLASVPRDEIVDAVRASGTPVMPRDSLVFLPAAEGSGEAADEEAPGADVELGDRQITALLAQAAASDPALVAPTVCILFDPANPRRVEEFRLISESAAGVGITVTDCSSPDWRALLATPGAYDVALYGLRAQNDSTASVAAARRDGSALNHSGYSNDEVESLLDELERETDAAERDSLLTRIDAILWRDGWGLPLFQLQTITAVSDEVTGVTRPPFAPTVLGNPWEWQAADEG